MTGSSAQLERQALFEIPFWQIELPEILPFHAEMIDEVEQSIDRTRDANTNEVFLADQTVEDPFDGRSEGWSLLDARMAEAYREIISSSFQRWRSGELHLRRWAIRLGRLDAESKKKLRTTGIHNHLPALFSSIYYLSVPDEMVDDEDGGTVFYQPLGNQLDLIAPRMRTIAPREGRLVVFPAFLDHAPVPVDWDARGKSRIVISSDIFYVSGKGAGPHSDTVSVAGGGA